MKKLNLNKNKIFNYVNNVCLCALIISFCFIIYNVLQIIINISNNHFNSYENAYYLSNQSLYIHVIMITFPMLLLLISAFFKKINFIHIGLCLLFSFVFNVYELINEIHYYINFLYPIKMQGNSQYTRLIIYGLILLLFSYKFFIKKEKTIHRRFILIMNIAVLMTLSIFHILLPMGVLKYEKKAIENRMIQEMNISSSPEKYCLYRSCFFTDKTLVYKGKLEGDYINWPYYIKQNNLDGRIKFLNNNEAITSIATPVLQKENFDFDVIAIRKNSENNFLVAIDKQGKYIARIVETVFSTLSAIAHLVWVYGCLFLIFFHERKFSKNQKPH